MSPEIWPPTSGRPTKPRFRERRRGDSLGARRDQFAGRGLRAITAEIGNGANRAIRFARLADIAPVQNQPVMRAELVLGGRHLFEPGPDLERRFSRRDGGAI